MPIPSPLAALTRIRRLCDVTVASTWIYQGAVPKLLGPHADEIAMSSAFGVPSHLQVSMSYAVGAIEIAFGLLVLFSRSTWPHRLSATTTAALLLFVALYAPRYLAAAFNPVVMNGASIALSIAALLAHRGMRPAQA